MIPSSEVAVRTLAISRDSNTLVAGTHKGRVFTYILDKETQKYQFSKDFQAHDEYLLRCILSQDGTLLATTSSDKTAKIWNTSTW